MALLDFFKRQKTEDLPEIPEEVFIEKNESAVRGESRSIVDASIDGVYEFLRADYETRGYHDALTNSDSSYYQENVDVLMWDLVILCDHSVIKYNDRLYEIENHISSRKKMGVLDVVQDLESEKRRIEQLISTIQKIKSFAEERKEAPLRVIKSYQRGFHRGLVALSKSAIKS